MSDKSKPFAFSQFVPGFDFLQNLASGGASAGASAVPGMPSLSSWVAPTLSVEEVDKRIQELKTVQYWLEQNGHALKATIQALEVQKMTLSTLRGMNVRMEDLASVFTRTANASATAPAPTAAPSPAPSFRAAAPESEPNVEEDDKEDAEADGPSAAKSKPANASGASAADGAGVVDPLQWWGALTQQFQQIAASALQEASQLKVPAVADAMGKAMGTAQAKTAASKPTEAAGKKTPVAGRRGTAAGKSSAAGRKRASGR
jgi:hypothetical protein